MEDPFMGVCSQTTIHNSLKMTFSHNFMRHLVLYSNFASKLLEVRHPGNRMVLLRELSKVFETAVESNSKIDSKISYKAIPMLASGLQTSNLSIVQNVNGNESLMKLNGELISIDNLNNLRNKLQKIYDRGCTSLKLPENISFYIILVRLSDPESFFGCDSHALQRLPRKNSQGISHP